MGPASRTRAMNFEKYVSTANAFVNEVAAELGITNDTGRARRVVRSVLHAVRARLPAEQSMHLLAQLPMLLKAVYVDGWKLSQSADPGIRTEDDFLIEMIDDDGPTAKSDFPDRRAARNAALAVFAVLYRHVAVGQLRHMELTMPRPIRRLMKEAEQRAAAREPVAAQGSAPA